MGWNKGLLDAIHVGQLLAAKLPKTQPPSSKDPDQLGLGENWYQIQGYQNGREQGITVWLFGNNITFYICRNRHTDNIGFYQGSHVFTGISQDAYSAGFYGYDSIEECAEAIVNEINYLFKL